jgi:2-polyprenyl-3-methyl-5-hydroxy-6-metoxy-1,4-benzoquinol methylase
MKFDYTIEANKKHWDELVEIHFSDSDYDVRGFLDGKNALKELELKELGDVNGKSMLHLQCHFGMDTLSWARLGANVTGIDFSEKAIVKARQLAKEISVNAKFITSDIYSLIENMGDEKFDIVFTSYGVLYWLPDLVAWSKVSPIF